MDKKIKEKEQEKIEKDSSKVSYEEYKPKKRKLGTKITLYVLSFALLFTGGLGSGVLALKMAIDSGFFNSIINPQKPNTEPEIDIEVPIESNFSDESKLDFNSYICGKMDFVDENNQPLIDRWYTEEEYSRDPSAPKISFMAYKLKNEFIRCLVPAVQKTGIPQESFDGLINAIKNIKEDAFAGIDFSKLEDPSNPGTILLNAANFVNMLNEVSLVIFNFANVLELIGLDSYKLASFLYFFIGETLQSFENNRVEYVYFLNELHADARIEKGNYAVLIAFIQTCPYIREKYMGLGYDIVTNFLKDIIEFLRVQSRYGIASFIQLLNGVKKGEIKDGDAFSAIINGVAVEFSKIVDPKTGEVIPCPKEIIYFLNDVISVVNLAFIAVPGVETEIGANITTMIRNIPYIFKDTFSIINRLYNSLIAIMKTAAERDFYEKTESGMKLVRRGAASIIVDLIGNPSKEFKDYDLYTLAKVINSIFVTKNCYTTSFIKTLFKDMNILVAGIKSIPGAEAELGNVDIQNFAYTFEQVKTFITVVSNPYAEGETISEGNWTDEFKEKMAEKFARQYYESYREIIKQTNPEVVLKSYDELDEGITSTEPSPEPQDPNAVHVYTKKELKDLFYGYYTEIRKSLADFFHQISNTNEPITLDYLVSIANGALATGLFILALPILYPIFLVFTEAVAVLGLFYSLMMLVFGQDMNTSLGEVWGTYKTYLITLVKEWFNLFGVDISQHLPDTQTP